MANTTTRCARPATPGCRNSKSDSASISIVCSTNKSLKYNCAYSLAFESIGPVYAEWWFGGADDVMQDADPSVVSLWKWHLAEEFEHRNVAYDVYQSLFGGYFYRIYAQYEFMRDLRVLTRGAVKYLLTEDSRQMNAGRAKCSPASVSLKYASANPASSRSG